MTINIINPWKYGYIRQLAEEATILAKKEGLQPIPASQAAMNYRIGKRFNVPFLGDYVPAGWELVAEVGFVDTTGRGKPGDPAMTADEFFQRASREKELAYAVIEAGQTQALVAAYRKESNATK